MTQTIPSLRRQTHRILAIRQSVFGERFPQELDPYDLRRGRTEKANGWCLTRGFLTVHRIHCNRTRFMDHPRRRKSAKSGCEHVQYNCIKSIGSVDHLASEQSRGQDTAT